MSKDILKYQKAFNSVVERLGKNDDVLAVMVFGSMVTGDLWQGSDIDIFVIMSEQAFEMRNIYTEENGISVHMKLFSRDSFLSFYERNTAGGYLHRILISSKLIFSKDEEITNIFNSFRYISDTEREKWNLVYLGKVLKDISHCRKLISNSSVKSAYSACMKVVEDFSNLFLNYNGYLVSKDVISVATNLDDQLGVILDKLIGESKEIEKSICETLEFVESFIDQNIKNCCISLIKFLRDNKAFMSSEEINNNVFFKGFEIHMEDILKELSKRKLLKKEFRNIKSSSGNIIGEENVYC